MTLVDREIKEQHDDLILEGYDEKNVNPTSYDLTVGSIILERGENDSFVLPQETTIFIKTKEKIHIPNDLLGHIGEKNSRMREGLWVSGPNYFPGHTTYCFLRVRNISPNEITIKSGDLIAQISFEKLGEVPDHPYNTIPEASFNEEDKYRGMGKYESEYEKRIRRVRDEKDDLSRMQGKIYANILTLMGLFVSIFSLIMVNFSQVQKEGLLSKTYILTINLSLGFVIALFMGLLLLVLNPKHRKASLIIWISIVIVLFVALLLIP
jgi:deoxycytidine triphosphate deaminase